MLVLTTGLGVDGFTLDPDKGVFLHTHEDIRIPAAGPIYSFNEANFHGKFYNHSYCFNDNIGQN